MRNVYCTELDKTFDSLSKAAEELDIDISQLAKVCKGQLKSIKGYHFSYTDTVTKEFSIFKTKSDRSHPYYIANKESSQRALAELSKSAFYLYFYFLTNADGYVGTLRRTHVMKITGLSKTSYYDAIDELIKKGYLVDAGDGYEFYENPDDNEEEL